MIRIGIVGAGGMGTVHYHNYLHLEDCAVVGVVDPSPAGRERAREWGVTVYETIGEMVAGGVTLVDVCTPTFLHQDHVTQALRAGAHVIVEKPCALTQADARAMFALAEEKGLYLYVAQVLQFSREVEVLRDLVREETYGKPLDAVFQRLSARPDWAQGGWLFDRRKSGLVPFDLHIHDLDFCIYAFGTPTSLRKNRIKLPKQDYISAVYEFPDFFITTECAWYSAPYPFTASFRFLFEKALVAWENGKCLIYQNDGAILDLSTDAQNDTGDIDLPQTNAYAEEIRYFKECVRTGSFPDKVKPEELKQVLRILSTL